MMRVTSFSFLLLLSFSISHSLARPPHKSVKKEYRKTEWSSHYNQPNIKTKKQKETILYQTKPDQPTAHAIGIEKKTLLDKPVANEHCLYYSFVPFTPLYHLSIPEARSRSDPPISRSQNA
ncbi:hypothetical protein QBC37DRAFT_94134 [Rhypophila decipiens]|uniref:Uncharacterized protein n=1 Tax=Rhypophila decipiens TaxID=261697 RepID=A0AAN7BCX2_9PEZI|nr:hypothetical protein QBC37DRAFT_94134 [Rhypophila decipiens]